MATGQDYRSRRQLARVDAYVAGWPVMLVPAL
jgi:hypothetical protein